MRLFTRVLSVITLLITTAAAAPATPTAFATIGNVQRKARMAADASDLRQIGQASLIYAQDHHDHFPAATDVWDYAALLTTGGLESPRFWQSRLDPAADVTPWPDTIILITPQTGLRQTDPAFRKFKLSLAIPIGVPLPTLPSSQPIAWTRGLLPDGTWAGHSPYGTRGGYIAFANGTLAFYKTLKRDADTGALTRFDGKGTTANILEALPTGARISEYQPTPEEQTAWTAASRTNFFNEHGEAISFFLLMSMIWGPFLFISAHRARHKKPGALHALIFPAFITFLASIILPMC